jgi:hypothetical protein
MENDRLFDHTISDEPVERSEPRKASAPTHKYVLPTSPGDLIWQTFSQHLPTNEHEHPFSAKENKLKL